MAIQLGSAYGKVNIDSTGVKTGVDNAVKSMGTLEKSAQRLGTTLQNVGKAMTAAVTIPLALMAKDAVMMASSYEESLNKVNVVFEDNGKVIEEWSKDAAKNLGMSQQAALEAAATYGNLFTAQGMGTKTAGDMSTALVQLSADLASFNNASPEEVLLALRSGLSGEIEPLKKYGVALNEAIMKNKAFEMGLGNNIQALTESEKIQVRYAIIMDQTTKAQGDFARTSEGLANQLRILKGHWGDTLKILGANLVPIVEKVLVQLNKWLEWFNNADPKTQKFIATLLLIAFVAGPLLIIFGKLLPLAFSGATKSLNPFSGGIFGLIGTAVKWLGVAALVVKALGFFGISTGAAGTAIVGLQAAIAGAGASLLALLGQILLLLAGPALLYWAFKTNFMGITDTAKQLWFIIKYYFGEMSKDVKKSATEISIAFYELVEGIRTGSWQFKALHEDGSGALLNLAMAFGFSKDAAQGFLAQIWLIIERFRELYTAITTSGHAFTVLFEDGSGALLNLAIALGFPAKAAQELLAKVFYLTDRFMQSIKRMSSSITNINWAGLGRNIIMGIVNGFLGGIPSLIAAATRAAEAALNAIKKRLGISSPSIEFMKLGNFSGQGYQAGLAKSVDPNIIAKTMARPVQQMTSQQNTRYQINMANGLTLRDLDEMMNRKIDKFTLQLNNALGGG